MMHAKYLNIHSNNAKQTVDTTGKILSAQGDTLLSVFLYHTADIVESNNTSLNNFCGRIIMFLIYPGNLVYKFNRIEPYTVCSDNIM